MAGPFAPDPDEEEEPEYSGPAAVLLPPQQQQQEIPPYIAAPDVPQQGAPQQAQSPQAGPPAVLLPTVPDAPASITPQYDALMKKTEGDGAKKVSPKWWERLAGAAVGFGVGYKEGPTAGIRAGGAVTNRGQESENADAAGRISRDQEQAAQLLQQQQLNQKGFEDQMTKYRGDAERAGAQQQQQNADRTFGRESTNDTRTQSNADRAFNYEQQIHGDQQNQLGVTNDFERQRLGETARHNRADEADSPANSVDRNAPRTTMTLNQFQGVLQQKDKAYADAKKAMNAELAGAVDDKDRADIKAKYDGVAQDLQNEWNQRLAQADPQGKYAPKGVAPPTVGAPAATAPVAPPPVQQPRPAAVAQPSAKKPPPPAPGNIWVQVPGQPPGQISAGKKAAFLAKYPSGKVL